MDQNKQLEKYRIVRKETLAKECFRLVVRCPDIAKRAQAGQFAHIRAEGFLLRRPISICEVDRAAGAVTLVFEVRGEGTKVISELREGDLIDMLAPLGNGFSLLPGKKAILIGGGIGTPPMLECAKFYGKSAIVITGFRSASAVILQKEFKRTGAEVILCTDDGTAGEKGFVTGPLRRCLERGSADLICACGPNGMLSGVVSLAKEFGVACEVSLEERMAAASARALSAPANPSKTAKSTMPASVRMVLYLTQRRSHCNGRFIGQHGWRYL